MAASAPEIQCVWVSENEYGLDSPLENYIESFDIRFDFHNDRHHVVNIRAGWTAKEIASALHQLAYAIDGDRWLEGQVIGANVVTAESPADRALLDQQREDDAKAYDPKDPPA